MERSNKFKIYEPMTTLTDLMLTVFTAIWALSLAKLTQKYTDATLVYWSNVYWMTALSAFLGALSHGIGPNLPVKSKTVLWRLTLIAIGWTAFFMLMGTFQNILSADSIKLLRWIPIILIIFYHIALFKRDEFSTAILFYAPVMVIVLIAYSYAYLYLSIASALNVVIGMIISFAAAVIQFKKIGIHKHLNHNDIFHVVQLVGLYFIYLGIKNQFIMIE
jgi:hypothetical protein